MRKYKSLLILLSGFLFTCQSDIKEKTKQTIKIDTIYYGGYFQTTYDEQVGPFELVNLNGLGIRRLYEDSLFKVKVTTGKQKDLKVYLKTDRNDIEIVNSDSLNHFMIKTQKITSKSEWTNFYILPDTSVSKLVVVQTEIDSNKKDKNLFIYHPDTLVTIGIKNYKK